MDDVEFEKKEEANIGYDKEPLCNILKYAFYGLIAILILALIALFYLNFSSEVLFQTVNLKDNINLTSDELNEFNQKFAIVNGFLQNESNSNSFTPIFSQKEIKYVHRTKNKVPLNKVSFMVSSSPKNAFLCKLYLDIWSTKFGSDIVKETGVRPLITIYWSYSDVEKYKLNWTKKEFFISENFNISLINQTSHHKKWFFMIYENIQTAPSDIEWFIMLDDDTLPFLDRILENISIYENPVNNIYFIHSPGERFSGLHYGNGGSGFIISRKLALSLFTEIIDCNIHIRRRFYNGDIRLDHCIRYKTQTMPILDYGMFQLDSKAFTGDLTGFVENYIDSYTLKSIHHLEKNTHFLFPLDFIKMMKENNFYNVHYDRKVPRNFLNNFSLDYDTFSNLNDFSQAAHFTHALVTSGDLFLKRFIVNFKSKNQNLCGILNLGYSFVVFGSNCGKKHSRNLKNEIFYYLKGVESTFESTPGVLYENLSRLIIPPNQNIKRFYFKKTETDSSGKHSYWQEFCSISSPDTVVKIHVDDNQQVSLDFINFTNS